MTLLRKTYKLMLALTALGMIGLAFAQAVEITNPGGWFGSPDTMEAAVALIITVLTRFLTAWGKEQWLTTGSRTVVVSAVISVVLAGIGGYLALGYYAEYGGFNGALRAAVMALAGFLAANLWYNSDKQVAEAGAKSAAAKTKLLR